MLCIDAGMCPIHLSINHRAFSLVAWSYRYATHDQQQQEPLTAYLHYGVDILGYIKVVPMAIVERSHELGMTQAPDFVPESVDDVSLLYCPAVPLQVL